MPRLGSLAAIEAEVWQELQRAAQGKAHAWKTPVLATVAGEAADARTVILREVNVKDRQLMFFTDQRSRKVAQLLRHPRATLVMWCSALGWQLRCRVLLSLEMTGLAAESRWARIKLTPAAQDYLAPVPPGAVLAQALLGAGATAAEHGPASSESAGEQAPVPQGHAYFAVVNAQVLSIDWLELHREGHRRALFGEDEPRWLQP